jgi:pimeloyl-ACP methyl ester carboxylesterase
VHVAGISLGGMVAQSLASRAPQRVRSLTLVDTALSIPPAQVWHDRAALVRKDGMEPLVESVVARWVTAASLQSSEAQALRMMLRRTHPEGYAAAAEAVAAADLPHSVSGLRMPTLVLVGDDDVATPLSSAEALRDAIPGARLEVIPDAAHIPTMEQPDHVIDAMSRFLESVRAGA